MQAILTFHEITCEDEAQYTCFVYFNNSGPVQNKELTTSFLVKVSPGILNSKPTWTPERGIEEGMNVTFTCAGDIGKPAGKFKLTKYRGSLSTNYTGTTTTSSQIPGNCTLFGTSVFSVRLEAEDNNAVIRCTVEHELITPDTLYTQTLPENLVVYYKVRNIQLTKLPDYPRYAEGARNLTLTCTSDGNPLPTYTWFNQSEMESVIMTGNKLLVTDLVYTIIYVCVSSNNYNGKNFSLTVFQLIQIDPDTTKWTLCYSEYSISGKVSLIGVVVSLLILQLCEVLVFLILYKKGIFIFKVGKQDVGMYDHVTNRTSNRHVYSTMNTAEYGGQENSERQDGNIYQTVH